MIITLSTYTDPNGTPRTVVVVDGTPVLQLSSHTDHTLRSAWGVASSTFESAHGSATLRRWDGDAKLKHTIATK